MHMPVANAPLHADGPRPGSDTLAAAVIAWQRAHGRNHLPWQGTRDPYRVWLSEIMLQQTQVSTVLGYYGRFVGQFPDVASLAAAPADAVMALWSGLGYYSRARNLHRCAQVVMSDWGGHFPRTARQLATLPGIGPSTAAAIAAFCYGERSAIMDANVRRVLSRVLAFGHDLAKAQNEKALWAIAQDLLPVDNLPEHMPRYTQGLMDLGAMLCGARQPQCPRCPLLAHCRAAQAGNPQDYPVKTRRTRRSLEHWWLLLLHDAQGRVWLQRRSAQGLAAQESSPGTAPGAGDAPHPGLLSVGAGASGNRIWAGLYAPPVYDSARALEAAVAALSRAAQPGGPSLKRHDAPARLHVLTHRDLHLHPVHLYLPPQAQLSGPLAARETPAGEAAHGAARWCSPAQWAALGLPAPVRQLLDEAGPQPGLWTQL